MSGNRAGGLKAGETNKKKYGEDFYKRLGEMGGHRGRGCGGFAANPELAKIAGSKGGKRSKRGPGKAKKESEEAKDRRITKNYTAMLREFKAIRKAGGYENKSAS